jgi:hypothetical protein
MKFQGDVRGAQFFHNRQEVTPLRGGHGPQAAFVQNQWVELKDVADQGYYVLAPEVFEPDSAGAPAVVSIAIKDLKNPTSPSILYVYGEPSARIWNDFLPYLRQKYPDRKFLAANPELKAARVEIVCDDTSGACHPKS